MAPIKFEDNIKDKLENRRLKPSVDAWDNLSERLDNQDKKKNVKPIWWLGIAASVIGVLLVVSQFVNKVEDVPVIVDSPANIEKHQIIEPLLSSEKQENKEASVDEKTHEKSEYKKILKEKTVIINSMNTNQPETAVAINEAKKEEQDIANIKSVEVLKKELSFEEQKIKDVVAKVYALKGDNVAVTDDDIDALLLEAQKEIRLNKIINETTGVVDADALLQDVEADLDQSFRSKVFEAIKSSYNSVKTAVAQRND
tara:strand:+ start:5538 stop:6305 length:768 start_codon:yes stop_codon:yes gene_type:complete